MKTIVKTYSFLDYLLGEISPRLEMKDDFVGRQHALSLCSNWFIHAQGTVATNPGIKHINNTGTVYSRLIPFAISPVNKFVIKMVNNPGNNAYIYNDTGTLLATVTHPWTTKAQLESVNPLLSHSENIIYLASNAQPPQQILWGGGTTFTLSIPEITETPDEWTGTNYPNVMYRFNGRTWFAGCPSNPTRLWGSKSNTYFDLTTGELADDALVHDIDGRGKILWMLGFNSMLIGTELNEIMVTSSDGVLKPGDIRSSVQSRNGSSAMQPVILGNSAVYLSADGRKLYALNFEWESDTWKSVDITANCEHLAREDKILGVTYVARPESHIICRTETGKLLYLTYNEAAKTVGASRRTLRYPCHDIVSVFDGSEDLLFVAQTHTDTKQLMGVITSSGLKLDNYVEVVSGTAIDTVTLGWLSSGTTVSVMINGSRHPDVILNSSSATGGLEWSGTTLQVGLPIYSEFVTLPLTDEIAGVGSIRNTFKKWVNLGIKLLDSYLPTITGIRPPDRSALTPMDTSTGPVTTTIHTPILGTTKEGLIRIEQEAPYHTEVIGIYGTVELDMI